MNFLSNINTDVILIAVGALALIGSFATINSASASKFDHDFALILLIAGVLCIGIGFDFISIEKLKELLPSNK